MARKIKLNGSVVASPASITVSVDGTQVFSGTVGADAELDTAIVLSELNIDNADDTVWATKNLVVSVTAGIVKIGTMPADIGTVADGYDFAADVDADGNGKGNQQDGSGYYNPGRNSSPYGDATERTSILVNGSAPSTLDNGGFDPGPTGSEHWSGWFFEVAAGETFSTTLRVPPTYTNYTPA